MLESGTHDIFVWCVHSVCYVLYASWGFVERVLVSRRWSKLCEFALKVYLEQLVEPHIFTCTQLVSALSSCRLSSVSSLSIPPYMYNSYCVSHRWLFMSYFILLFKHSDYFIQSLNIVQLLNYSKQYAQWKQTIYRPALHHLLLFKICKNYFPRLNQHHLCETLVTVACF